MLSGHAPESREGACAPSEEHRAEDIGFSFALKPPRRHRLAQHFELDDGRDCEAISQGSGEAGSRHPLPQHRFDDEPKTSGSHSTLKTEVRFLPQAQCLRRPVAGHQKRPRRHLIARHCIREPPDDGSLGHRGRGFESLLSVRGQWSSLGARCECPSSSSLFATFFCRHLDDEARRAERVVFSLVTSSSEGLRFESVPAAHFLARVCFKP